MACAGRPFYVNSMSEVRVANSVEARGPQQNGVATSRIYEENIHHHRAHLAALLRRASSRFRSIKEVAEGRDKN
jgi:hypothetical protein